MLSTLSISRRLIPFGFAAEYNLRIDLPQHQLSQLVDGCVQHLVPLLHDGYTLNDIKGRDALNLINTEIHESFRPRADELLFVKGEVLTATSSVVANTKTPLSTPFEVRIHTHFKEFVGSHHIAHTVRIDRHGSLPEDIPITALGRVFPIRIDNFRLGIDIFKSKFLSGTFGFAPTATQTLLIESDARVLQLRISADSLSKRDTLPLSFQDIFTKLQTVLMDSVSVDLLADYKNKLDNKD